MEGLRVRPITYNLDIGRELMNPCYTVSSGSFSQEVISGINEDVHIDRKEKGSIFIEVRDGEELIGKGEVKYSTLADREGMFNEWIPLRNADGDEVGQVLVEIEISPEAGKIHGGFNGMLKDMKETFGNLGSDVLPSQNFPSVKGEGSENFGFMSDGQMGIDNPNPDMSNP